MSHFTGQNNIRRVCGWAWNKCAVIWQPEICGTSWVQGTNNKNSPQMIVPNLVTKMETRKTCLHAITMNHTEICVSDFSPHFKLSAFSEDSKWFSQTSVYAWYSLTAPFKAHTSAQCSMKWSRKRYRSRMRTHSCRCAWAHNRMIIRSNSSNSVGPHCGLWSDCRRQCNPNQILLSSNHWVAAIGTNNTRQLQQAPVRSHGICYAEFGIKLLCRSQIRQPQALQIAAFIYHEQTIVIVDTPACACPKLSSNSHWIGPI